MASEPFITDHMPPHLKVALTYLKHVPLAETEYEPPPVMTVGLAQGLLPLGVAVRVGVFVGGAGVFVRVGVLVGPMGVCEGVAVAV